MSKRSVAKDIEDEILSAVESPPIPSGVFDGIRGVKRHEEAGLWGTTGLLVTMADGAVYQIAIVRLPGGPS